MNTKEINPLTIKGNHTVAWLIVRRALLKKAQYKCGECGGKVKLDIHHKDGCGLNNKLDNLIVLCHACHMLLGNQTGSGTLSPELRIPEDDYFRPPLVPLDKSLLHAIYDDCFPRA